MKTNDTIVITNGTLNVELSQSEWHTAVEDARRATAQRGDQTPEQWARGIILNRESLRRRRQAERDALAAQTQFVRDHTPNTAWIPPIQRCLEEFLPTGWYSLDRDGLLADTGVRFTWEAVADVGILYLATEAAAESVQPTEEESKAMRLLDRDIDRNVMPLSQFDHLHAVIAPYAAENGKSVDVHRARLRAEFGVNAQTADSDTSE